MKTDDSNSVLSITLMLPWFKSGDKIIGKNLFSSHMCTTKYFEQATSIHTEG